MPSGMLKTKTTEAQFLKGADIHVDDMTLGGTLQVHLHLKQKCIQGLLLLVKVKCIGDTRQYK